MYIEGKVCWLNHLDAAMEIHNNRVHGTTKRTPFEMITNKLIRNNDTAKLASLTKGALRTKGASRNRNNKNRKLPKFQVGDYVRVAEHLLKRLYNKLE